MSFLFSINRIAKSKILFPISSEILKKTKNFKTNISIKNPPTSLLPIQAKIPIIKNWFFSFLIFVSSNMKFNEKFLANFKIKKKIDEECVSVQLLDTGKFECEVKDTICYGRFFNAYENDVFKCLVKFVKKEDSYYLACIEIPSIILPAKREEMVKYLSKQIKGVGSAIAKLILDKLGDNFIEEINKKPEILEELGIHGKKCDAVRSWCEAHCNFSEIIGEINLAGFSPFEAIEIFKKYGSKSVSVIQENPYILYLDELVPYKKIKDIVLKSENEKYELETFYGATIMNAFDNYRKLGSMACLKSLIIKDTEKVLMKESFNKGLNFLISKAYICEKKYEDDYLIKPSDLFAEETIAKYISEVKDKTIFSKGIVEANLKDYELNKQQRESVYGCLNKRFSILTGGPGTGKTFTIKRIIKTVRNIDPKHKILLMAPTGKAASRMTEMINEKKLVATTIHAALKINESDDLDKKVGDKLIADLIIIDEASMIDEHLFAYFCRNIDANTQVILVGDVGQLPSVEGGNLLQELTQNVPVFTLTTIQRQKQNSPIVMNAHYIRNKEFDKIVFDDKEFKFIETDDIVDVVKNQYLETNYVPDASLILSPQHNRKGTDEINKAIQMSNPNPVIKIYKQTKYKVGDRVIQTKNTKDLDIHNGDLGTVDGLGEKGILVKFDNKDDLIEITDLEHLILAYAITVHKSQGSEAEIIIMVFNKGHLFTLSNKLIYTALTRTKEIFIGVGHKEVFFEGIEKEEKPRISLISKIINSIII